MLLLAQPGTCFVFPQHTKEQKFSWRQLSFCNPALFLLPVWDVVHLSVKVSRFGFKNCWSLSEQKSHINLRKCVIPLDLGSFFFLLRTTFLFLFLLLNSGDVFALCRRRLVLKRPENVRSGDWKTWGPLRSFHSQSKIFASKATIDGSAYFSVWGSMVLFYSKPICRLKSSCSAAP